jgi:hypothetical protein
MDAKLHEIRQKTLSANCIHGNVVHFTLPPASHIFMEEFLIMD